MLTAVYSLKNHLCMYHDDSQYLLNCYQLWARDPRHLVLTPTFEGYYREASRGTERQSDLSKVTQ